MITLYGIPNCDSVKKAKTWLAENNLDYHFHNYKKDGIDKVILEQWCHHFGLDKVLNRRGTTWRKLPEQQKEGITQQEAIALMIEQPSLIKRPVLSDTKPLLIGFSPEEYKTLL